MLNINLIKMFMFVWLISQYLCGTEMCASINRLVGTVCSTVLQSSSLLVQAILHSPLYYQSMMGGELADKSYKCTV